MITIIIDSKQQKRFAVMTIQEMDTDGKMTVEIKKTSQNATAKQRRLNWLWCGEIAASGVGSKDTKEDVHTWCKWKFAKPILLRDDEVFPVVYGAFQKTVTGSDNYAEYCRIFAEQYISTERLTKRQRAEYLTEMQRFWIMQGVELTDPALQGVDLSKI